MADGGGLNIALYGDQHHFVVSDKHYTLLNGGIGSGKSVGGAVKALLASQGQIGHVPIPTPNLGVVTAPDYNILRDATMLSFREIAEPYIDIDRSSFSPPMRIRMRNGSEIIFKSAHHPEKLRGPNAAWWWGDEAALYDASVWKIMIGRLRQFGAFGYGWLTTTPKGGNWIRKRFVDNPSEHMQMWTVSTWQNPHVSLEWIASLAEDYDDTLADQELRGLFVSFEGLIYPEFGKQHMIAPDKLPKQYAQVIAAQDWGFVHPGVLLVFGITGDGRAYCIHEEWAKGRGIDEWADVALQQRNIHGISKVVCDPSEPDYIAKYKAKGINAVAADNTVSSGIQAVRRRLQTRADGLPGLMFSTTCVHTFVEFEQYHWAKRQGVTLDQPVKALDDCMDPTRYCCMEIDPVKARKPLTVEVVDYLGGKRAG